MSNLSNDIGELLFKAKVDLAEIDKEIAAIQKRFDAKPIKLKLSLDEANLRQITDRVANVMGRGAAVGVGVGGGFGAVSNAIVGHALAAGQIASSASGQQSLPAPTGTSAMGSGVAAPPMGVIAAPGIVCPHCGNVLRQGATWCPKCGQNVHSLLSRVAGAVGAGLYGVGAPVVAAGMVAPSVLRGGYRALKAAGRVAGGIHHALTNFGGHNDTTLDDVIEASDVGFFSVNDTLGRLNLSGYNGPSASDIGASVSSHFFANRYAMRAARGNRRGGPRPPGGGGGYHGGGGPVEPYDLASGDEPPHRNFYRIEGTLLEDLGEGEYRGDPPFGPHGHLSARDLQMRYGSRHFGATGMFSDLFGAWRGANRGIASGILRGQSRLSRMFSPRTATGRVNLAAAAIAGAAAHTASMFMANENQLGIAGGSAAAGGDLGGVLNAVIAHQTGMGNAVPILGPLTNNAYEYFTGYQRDIASNMAGIGLANNRMAFRAQNAAGLSDLRAGAMGLSEDINTRLQGVTLRGNAARLGNNFAYGQEIAGRQDAARAMDQQASETGGWHWYNLGIHTANTKRKIKELRSAASGERSSSRTVSTQLAQRNAAQDALDESERRVEVRNYNYATQDLQGENRVSSINNDALSQTLAGNTIGAQVLGFDANRVASMNTLVQQMRGATTPGRLSAVLGAFSARNQAINKQQQIAMRDYGIANNQISAQVTSGIFGLQGNPGMAAFTSIEAQREAMRQTVPSGQMRRYDRLFDVQQAQAFRDARGRDTSIGGTSSRMAAQGSALSQAAGGDDFHGELTQLQADTQAELDDVRDSDMSPEQKQTRVNAIRGRVQGQLKMVNRRIREASFGGSAASFGVGGRLFANLSSNPFGQEDLKDALEAASKTGSKLNAAAINAGKDIAFDAAGNQRLGKANAGAAAGDQGADKQDIKMQTNLLQDMLTALQTIAKNSVGMGSAL